MIYLAYIAELWIKRGNERDSFTENGVLEIEINGKIIATIGIYELQVEKSIKVDKYTFLRKI